MESIGKKKPLSSFSAKAELPRGAVLCIILSHAAGPVKVGFAPVFCPGALQFDV